jgi:DNA-binding NarL/FixJ family response regulator
MPWPGPVSRCARYPRIVFRNQHGALGSYLRGDVPELAPEARAILRALGAGLTDEVAARQLGTSLRTYRRRVAELMAELEADSRFQAGLRVGELGLAH